MPKKDRRPSGDEWFVYMVRCADDSLYTGIAKDVTRRYLISAWYHAQAVESTELALRGAEASGRQLGQRWCAA